MSVSMTSTAFRRPRAARLDGRAMNVGIKPVRKQGRNKKKR